MKALAVAGFAGVIVMIGLTSGPSDGCPPLLPTRPLTGDATPLVGIYKGSDRGQEMVIQVTHTPVGIAFALNGAGSIPLTWVKGGTFRDTSSPALLTFRGGTNNTEATELRFDRGGDHFILKRQETITRE